MTDELRQAAERLMKAIELSDPADIGDILYEQVNRVAAADIFHVAEAYLATGGDTDPDHILAMCGKHWVDNETKRRIGELKEEIHHWQLATTCANPETISLALHRFGEMLGRTPTEGIPDAITRVKKDRKDLRDLLQELVRLIEGDDTAPMQHTEQCPAWCHFRDVLQKARYELAKQECGV